MRFIVSKKLYDTDKAELICTGLKKWDINAVVYARLSTSLYRTSKGTFFIVAEDGKMCRMKIIDQNEAENFCLRNDYEKYVEIFGELEEG